MRAICNLFESVPSGHFGVISVVFLRFFGVIIASPEVSKIQLPTSIDAAVFRRGLILASKMIQNIANGVTFKEDFMKCFDPMAVEYQPKMEQFYAAMMRKLPEDQCNPSSFPATNPALRIPKSDCVDAIMSMIKPNQGQFLRHLRANNEEQHNDIVDLPISDLVQVFVNGIKANTDSLTYDSGLLRAFEQVLIGSDVLLCAVCEQLNAQKSIGLQNIANSFVSVFLANTGLCISPIELIADYELEFFGDLAPYSMTSKMIVKYANYTASKFYSLIGTFVTEVYINRERIEV